MAGIQSHTCFCPALAVHWQERGHVTRGGVAARAAPHCSWSRPQGSRHSRVTLAILSLNLSSISSQNRQNGLKQSKLGQKECKWMWHKNRIASEGSWRGYLNFYVCGPRVLRGVVRSRISEDTAPRKSDTAATTQQQQSQLCLSVYCKESSFQIRFVHNFSIHLLLFLLK